MQATSLPYHEPSIVTILTHASFLLLLNVGNFVIDHSLYCGLLAQVALGVAWGTPGGKWLGEEAEEIMVQLGYLGLLLLVYEGGLSTSLKALKANLALSSCIAITGIGIPVGFSFVLQSLANATPLQAFAAGAALCSTSLGTTFTVLRASGFISSRLGVVLASAAMMDDVVGLVMVQIISNLGASGASISAVTVVRPLLISVGFAVCTPLACLFVAKPFTVWLNAQRTKRPQGLVNRTLTASGAAWTIHTAILVGLVTGSTYAGTSNLFAAYIAGAAISWWDSEVVHPAFDGPETRVPAATSAGYDTPASRADATPTAHQSSEACQHASRTSGLETFEMYYSQPLERILKPFFFASIGFSIPITEMFHGPIVWKGIVYAILMTIGKVACGAWLLRISLPWKLLTKVSLKFKPNLSHFWGRKSKKQAAQQHTEGSTVVQPPTTPQKTGVRKPTDAQSAEKHTETPGDNPRSLYPAAILGCAMTARGEIGFLISSLAEGNGVFSSPGSQEDMSSDIFLVVTWAIVLCTILGPLAVGVVIGRVKKLQEGVEKQGRVVRRDVLGAWGI